MYILPWAKNIEGCHKKLRHHNFLHYLLKIVIWLEVMYKSAFLITISLLHHLTTTSHGFIAYVSKTNADEIKYTLNK
jgi:hypothetical protein